MNHTVYLGLGSNIGDRRLAMVEAIDRIGKSIGTVVRQSTFYETEPWGFESENMFLNAVVCVETSLCPLCLLKATQNIEFEMGRTEKYLNVSVNVNENENVNENDSVLPSSPVAQPSTRRNYHDRIIDIDILLYDDITVELPELKIPHPLMREREFVMKPLNEILLSQT